MKLSPIILFLIGSTAYAQKDCVLKLQKDSIQVYSCPAKGTKFKASKTDFIINSSPSQLVAMVFDIDFYKSWQYKTVSAKILKKVSDHEIIYYTEVDSPQPASNRDFVIKLTAEQNTETKEIIIEAVSIPDYMPAYSNMVRVPYSIAKWTVKPISASKLSVEYYIEIDLGGYVPAWLVNLVAHQAPYETFKALKDKIGAYKGSKVSYIKD